MHYSFYILEFHQREKFFKSSLAPSRVHCKLYSLLTIWRASLKHRCGLGAMEQAGLAQGCVTTWECCPELMPGRGEWRVDYKSNTKIYLPPFWTHLSGLYFKAFQVRDVRAVELFLAPASLFPCFSGLQWYSEILCEIGKAMTTDRKSGCAVLHRLHIFSVLGGSCKNDLTYKNWWDFGFFYL